MPLLAAPNSLPQVALLYADPGSGMLIWQLITAAALGLLFYARTIFRKIRDLIGNGRTDEESSADK
ncbi:MAG TPA: hypothetical protein VLE19_09545 [Pyrinomonadaceae bacterium]|nr:hypothetical protein [Pyrinomonadaceae bacterium]